MKLLPEALPSPQSPPLFSILTLGCKLNSYESEDLAKKLREIGFKENNEKFDLIIINSCAVTDKALKKTLKLCRQKKREMPLAKLIVFGCGVRLFEEQFSKVAEHTFPYSDQVFSYLGDTKAPLELHDKTEEVARLKIKTRTRKLIKIQEGCDNFCSFCIVCLARGRSANRPDKEIIREINEASQSGYREIVLTGTNVASYGCNNTQQYQKTKFSSLLKKILEKTSIERIRLSSLGPQYLDEDFLALIEEERLCHHFHLSLQHTEDEILQGMRRPYDQKKIKDLIYKIKKTRPDACIATDIIVGFPSETRENFEKLKKNLKKLPLSRIHVFPFSPRQKTAAYKLKTLPAEEVANRAKDLNIIAQEKWKLFLERSINTKQKVLLETNTAGHSKNYLPILLADGEGASIGEVIEVEIMKFCKRQKVLLGKKI